MNVITTFNSKRREKQIKHERSLLKELSIQLLSKSVQKYFGGIRMQGGVFLQQGLEEGCYDVAIEAYLLGAQFSRFAGLYEEKRQIQARCEKEMKHLIDTLFNFWLYWGKIGEEIVFNDSLYFSCEGFIEYWWNEGFTKADKRRKMRLH
ncbi:DUF2521 family protein [Falsibacillus pallidus]|uniref:Uncharacterized protein DUF2521 n=1 Tax=Falsibacillus pallidus TaxID=493781 RepID=A0A370G593_9BACI|nr:DUF2521 family protein [Falsibacillus pallidus]RDI38972.1 uncharacterized protein DUF2521 [Falsibacillus pallidus]